MLEIGRNKSLGAALSVVDDPFGFRSGRVGVGMTKVARASQPLTLDQVDDIALSLSNRLNQVHSEHVHVRTYEGGASPNYLPVMDALLRSVAPGWLENNRDCIAYIRITTIIDQRMVASVLDILSGVRDDLSVVFDWVVADDYILIRLLGVAMRDPQNIHTDQQKTHFRTVGPTAYYVSQYSEATQTAGNVSVTPYPYGVFEETHWDTHGTLVRGGFSFRSEAETYLDDIMPRSLTTWSQMAYDERDRSDESGGESAPRRVPGTGAIDPSDIMRGIPELREVYDYYGKIILDKENPRTYWIEQDTHPDARGDIWCKIVEAPGALETLPKHGETVAMTAHFPNTEKAILFLTSARMLSQLGKTVDDIVYPEPKKLDIREVVDRMIASPKPDIDMLEFESSSGHAMKKMAQNWLKRATVRL